MLIDCDIHLGYETLADLLPYLDGPTRELVAHSGTNGLAMPSYPWNHPTGWIRQDTYERGDGHQAEFPYLTARRPPRRCTSTATTSTLGIVEPDEAAAFAVLPNAHLAARLCSAYNDWLLEHWLQEEPRLRGMIVVPAQYPEAAAREIRRLGGRDEFVGVFLPGAARIPYGNPVYDPLWEAVERARAPGRRPHPLRERRHRRPDHRRRHAGLLRRVPHALRLGHVRPLRLHPLPRHLRALPRRPGGDGGRRPGAVRGLPLAARHELEELQERDPVVPAPAVGVRLGSRALRHAAARVAGRPATARAPRSSSCAPGTR